MPIIQAGVSSVSAGLRRGDCRRRAAVSRHQQLLLLPAAALALAPPSAGGSQSVWLAARCRDNIRMSLLASPMWRALQTAKPLCGVLGVDLQVDPSLCDGARDGSLQILEPAASWLPGSLCLPASFLRTDRTCLPTSTIYPRDRLNRNVWCCGCCSGRLLCRGGRR